MSSLAVLDTKGQRYREDQQGQGQRQGHGQRRQPERGARARRIRTTTVPPAAPNSAPTAASYQNRTRTLSATHTASTHSYQHRQGEDQEQEHGHHPVPRDLQQQQQQQHGATALRKAYSLSSLSSSPRKPVFVFPSFAWQVRSGSSSPAATACASDDLDKQQRLRDERQKLLPELLNRVNPKPSCLKRAASAPQLHGESPLTSPEPSPLEPALDRSHQHTQQQQQNEQQQKQRQKQRPQQQQQQQQQEDNEPEQQQKQHQAAQQSGLRNHIRQQAQGPAEVGMDDTGSFPSSPSAPIELAGHVAQAIDNLPPSHVTRREVKRHSTEILSAPDVSKIMLVSPRRRQRTRRLRWRDETGQRLCSSIYFDKTQPACECSLNPPAILRTGDSASPTSQLGATSGSSSQAPSSPRPLRSLLSSRLSSPSAASSPASASALASGGRAATGRAHAAPTRSSLASSAAPSTSYARSSLLSSASPPSSWAQAWQSPYVGGATSAYSSSRLTKNSSNSRRYGSSSSSSSTSGNSGYSSSNSSSNSTSEAGEGTDFKPCKTTFTFVDANKLPHNRVEMLQALGRKCVQLEELTIRAPHLFFTIRVFNLAFEKAVVIRYTTDAWRTHKDVDAHYLPGTSEPSTDRFYANLSLPLFSKDGHMQFAICYRSQGKEFWDNNDGANYTVTVTRVPFMRFGSSPSPSPPSSRKDSATEPGTAT